VAVLAAMLASLPAHEARAATPSTQPDEVGMVDGRVRAIAIVGNQAWVGGTFTALRDANGAQVATVSSLAVFDAVTGAPVTVAVPKVTKGSGAGTVYDLSLGPDGLLYLAGTFDRVGGLPRKNVAAVDPGSGAVTGFAPNTSAAKSVLATSGAIYIGTSRLLSFESNGSPSPGYAPPQTQTDPSLRGHNTPPQVRDMVLVGSSVIAACQCDSTVENGAAKNARAAIKVDANTGAVQDWTPGNLSANSAAFGIGLLVQTDPGSGEPTVYLAAGGSDFVAAYDVATGEQVFKTDTSGSAQAVAWLDGMLYVGGHFQWVAKQRSQSCQDNSNPNTACHHAPRLVVIDPDDGRVIPAEDPWNPGICCRYNGVWALTPDPGRGRLHVGGEFTKAGGTWADGGTSWTLQGARTQAYYARFSATPTTLIDLRISFAGTGGGRVRSDPPAADCTDDCQVGFVPGTQVTLTADPAAASTFAGWSGDCSGKGPCTVTMDRARSVTATFTTGGSTSPTCGRVAYTSRRNGNTDVYTMKANGVPKDRLTTGKAADRDPAWSPDCARIAFTSNRTGNAEIFVMNADGTGRKRLTHSGGADTSPAWSPDGARIAFTSKRTGNAEIFVMNADGTGVTRLTRRGARDRAPAWSPDGGRIAFESDHGGSMHVWTMNDSGGALSELTGGPSRSMSPAYSPDGDTIALVRVRGGIGRVWVIDADGSDPRRLSRGGGAHSHPSFSPNGKRVAFASTRSGRSQIWIVKTGGSSPWNVSRSTRADSQPSWS
jgi:TolB protein